MYISMTNKHDVEFEFEIEAEITSASPSEFEDGYLFCGGEIEDFEINECTMYIYFPCDRESREIEVKNTDKIKEYFWDKIIEKLGEDFTPKKKYYRGDLW